MPNHDLELRLVAIKDNYTPGLEFRLINGGTEYEVFKDSIGDVTEVVIPEYYSSKPVTRIGFRAFDGCSNLTTINISDTINRIGDYAFNDCTNLAEISIPDSVTSIGRRPF